MTTTMMWPARFADLKREIAEATPDYEKRLTESWNDLLQELDRHATEIVNEGPTSGAHVISFAYEQLS